MLEGGKLDLLALDQQGQLVVIEIKRGMLYRDVIAQALDYASCIAMMPYAELSGKIAAYFSTNPSARSQATEALLQLWRATEDASSVPRAVITIVVGTGKSPGLERMASICPRLSVSRSPW